MIDEIEGQIDAKKIDLVNAQLQNAMDLAQLANWEFDVSRNLFIFNDRLYTMYGTTAEIEGGYKIFVNDHLKKFTHPDDVKYVQEELKKALQSSNPDLSTGLESRIIRCDGEIRYMAVRIKIIRSNNDQIIRVYGTVQDITERKLMEIKMEQLIDKLEVSNRELEQFAYLSSHDLKEPLRMITSFLELLQGKYLDIMDEDANEFINYAVQGAKRLDMMIDDLLEYSRIGKIRGEFKDIKIENIVKLVLLNLKPSIEDNNASITWDLLPTIYANEQEMIRLFQNLMSNSIKYMGQKNPNIHISATVVNDEYLFALKDNGIGIEPNNLRKIFTIFQRLHTQNEYEGTGIGLAISQKIVLQYGGKIWAESKYGEGSTFYFTIPKSNPNIVT